MASLIKGIKIILHEKVKVGEDEFRAAIWEIVPVEVENVLVTPVSTGELASEMQFYGKKAEYELCIPKGDTHNWEDSEVEFFGEKWRTYGFCQQLIEELVPLEWNRKIKVERYG